MGITKNATRKSSNANLKIVVVLVAVSLFFFVLLHYEISISKKAKDDILVTTSVAKTGKPRKVFVDLGANCGNSYYRHRKAHKDDADDWEVYLWEPSPQMHHFYLNDLKEEYPSVNIIPYAASVKDGEMELFVHEGQEHVTEKTQFRMQGECKAESRYNPSGGTTLFAGAKVAGDPVSVKVVNFPMWLKKLNLNEDDKFILKLDIEAAEFEILEQMLWDKDDNNLCLTELIQVEFHPSIVERDASLHSKYMTFDKDFPSIFKQKCGRNVNLEQLF
mmetsp:Transcript_3776/g.5459  ORF Transcript_3776/g.5459 Transcript_3776/m.5459 type:complete len:275 (-) Transcript_3776:136-960(-)